MKQGIHKLGVSISAVLLAVSLLFAIPVSSQENLESITLGITPQILDVTANPGELLENNFRLTNASSQEVVITTTPKNFTPRGEEGAVDLTVDDTSFSLADWITVSPQDVSIGPGQTQDFTVGISVPSDAEPGSHFGSVVFQTVPPEQPGSTALVSQEIAPVILVKVAGDIVETAEIVDFTTGESTYSDQKTVDFLARIENTGSVHFKPTGTIEIKDMFGSTVETIDFNQQNVLPDSIRQITTSWDIGGFKIGRYTAELTLVYGDSNEIRKATTSFIIFPYQTLVPIGLAAVAVVFVLVRFRKRLLLAAQVLSGKDSTDKSSSDK